MNDSNGRAAKIHPKVFAKIAAHEALQQEGVVRIGTGLVSRLRRRKTRGVVAHIRRNGSVHLHIPLTVRFGVDLQQLGSAVQHAVYNGVERASDQPVEFIRVTIADLEFAKTGKTEPEKG